MSNRFQMYSNSDSIPVAHASRYPPVAVTKKNSDYVKLLMPDFASAASEMTTVHQYLYQGWVIKDEFHTIRRVIERIAKVEQRHFSILGQLIAMLGGCPECRAAEASAYWCGNMVNYSTNIREILSENAKAEQYAAKTYLEQSQEIKDPLIARMLARLALDEELHHKIFCDLLSGCQAK